MIEKLFFGFGNAKLSKNIATFSLPAGYTCPFAKICLSKANRITGKLTDGPNCKVRCFSASQESLYTNVRKTRWKNFELLKDKNVNEMSNLIQHSLPTGIDLIRLAVSGDYYNEKYFVSWLNVALNNPSIKFYGYTKALPYLVKYNKDIPKNLVITASKGGTHDYMIDEYNLNYAEIVFSTEEARRKGLEIDHDDSHAIKGNHNFALLIHGTQPPNSEASKAWQIIKKTIGGYNKYRKHPIEKDIEIKIKMK